MSAIERVAWTWQGYAGFWQRVGGLLVDLLLLIAAGLVLRLVAGIAVAVSGGDALLLPVGVGRGLRLLLVIGFLAYDTVLTHRQGATVGKRAAGIEVRRPDGTLPSYGVCLGRFFARLLSGLALGVGFLWAAFDERRRTLHDILVDTVVVQRAATVPARSAPAAARPAAEEARPSPAEAAAGGPEGRPGPRQAPPAEPRPEPGEQQPGEQEAPPAQGSGLSGATLESARWGAAAEPEPSPGPAAEPEPPPGPRAEPAPPAAAPADRRPSAAPSEADPNHVAVQRAGLSPAAARWLHQVADQVDPRLDRVTPGWRRSAQAAAARACAFGILLGQLARMHPHMTGDLSRVAEVHPSFSTLLAGSRLATLEQIAAEPVRATAWLGPLIDVDDPERIARLLA